MQKENKAKIWFIVPARGACLIIKSLISASRRLLPPVSSRCNNNVLCTTYLQLNDFQLDK